MKLLLKSLAVGLVIAILLTAGSYFIIQKSTVTCNTKTNCLQVTSVTINRGLPLHYSSALQAPNCGADASPFCISTQPKASFKLGAGALDLVIWLVMATIVSGLVGLLMASRRRAKRPVYY